MEYNKRLLKGLFIYLLYYFRKLLPLLYIDQILNSFKVNKNVPHKDLPKMENYEKVSERVYRILGLNAGPHTLQGTNTYLIGTDASKALIDTGEEATSKEYIKLLFDKVMITSNTTNISKIILTHGHYDHQGGVKAILNECIKRKMFPLPTIHKYNQIKEMYYS